MSDTSSASFSSESHLPLVLAPDAQADAAVLAADAIDFVTREGDGDEGGALEAFEAPEVGLAARDTNLEQALDAVALDDMTAQEVTELESGDAERMAAVLKVKDSTDGRPAEDGSGLNRVSIKALPPALRLKLVAAISRTRDGGDFEQALREVFPGTGVPEGGMPQAAGWPEAHTPHAGEAEARPMAMAEVADLEARLAGVKEAYEVAKAEYDPRAQDLLEEMMDVKLDLREAHREQTGFLQEQRASYERAMEEHGDLMGEAGSPFLDLCDMTISLAERNNDPILMRPDWPERIAKQVRGRFFTGAAARSVARSGGGWPQQQGTVPPAPNQKVRLPGSPVGNGFAPGSITPETALAEFDQLTPEDQEAALAEIARVTDGRRRR